eukprot:Phypoly_transcript_01691.p1 GENE.Phypoly_transcript_01691~~Phypoly_transcript_01691.p1  ORF type:complete len:1022 (+),score=174.74 Phypoly_transcript_01691:50-3115(+)
MLKCCKRARTTNSKKATFSTIQVGHSRNGEKLDLKQYEAKPTDQGTLEQVISKLYIHSLEDWYDVPKSHFKFASAKLQKQYETIENFVKAHYPSHQWDHSRFAFADVNQHIHFNRFSPQIFLERVVRAIFPHATIKRNMRKGLGLKVVKSSEIDVYLPELRLGFEYQDQYHFFEGLGSQNLSVHKERDRIKLLQAEEKGITLICVPFWWDGDMPSLLSLIANKRPDLIPPPNIISKSPLPLVSPSPLSPCSDPILLSPLPSSLSPPLDLFHKPETPPIPSRSSSLSSPELLNSPPLLSANSPPPLVPPLPPSAHLSPVAISLLSSPLPPPLSLDPPAHIARKYDYNIPDFGLPTLAMYMPRNQTFDPTGLLIFEKFDGIRGVWHPHMKSFFTRWGNPLPTPNFIIDSMPNTWLDGEIWFGLRKGARYDAIKAVKSSPFKVKWDEFKYVVFDIPQPELREQPYVSRHRVLEEIVQKEHPFVLLAEYEICTSRSFVESKFFTVRNKGGEGVILRNPEAPYIQGYSHALYKHKGDYDAEARVIRKLSDSLFLCQLYHPNPTKNMPSNFIEISMPIESSRFEGDPKEIEIGSFVSFKFRFYQNGSPVNPIIYTVRNDITSWDQIIHSKSIHQEKSERIWKPPNMITVKRGKKDIDFPKLLDDYAKECNFDPLVPNNWYNVSAKDIQRKFGIEIPKLHRVLMDTYPHIGLREDRFAQTTEYFWQDARNCRRLLCELAEEMKFDPLITENWYTISKEDVLRHEKGKAMLAFYNNSQIKPIIHAFPELHFSPLKFAVVPQKYWSDPKNRKAFFDSVAKAKGFDPLVAENWYPLTLSDFMKFKAEKASGVLSFYGSSPRKALMDVYPDIGLAASKFRAKYSLDATIGSTSEKQSLKPFFAEFAKSKGLDPLVPENWYLVTLSDIRNFLKKSQKTLRPFQYDHIEALLEFYPNIGLRPGKFISSGKYWNNTDHCKNFFLEFAKEHKFDPWKAENWCAYNAYHLSPYPAATSLLSTFNGSFTQAIHSLFPK